MSSIFIEAKNLGKTYYKGSVEVTPLKELDLTVERGDFISLMGPSGSGKTTLLNLLAGIDSPTSGALYIDGTAIHGLSRRKLTQWRAKTVGYIFQLYHLVPVLTAYENVELPLLLQRLSSKERRQRVEQALELVGLSDRSQHFPRELSGGQEQRVAVARALVAEAPLLVADEPTGDLDGQSAEEILALLKSLQQEHDKTIIMVTHDPKAASVADRQLHLDKGRLVSTVEVVS